MTREESIHPLAGATLVNKIANMAVDLLCVALTAALLSRHRVFSYDTWWHLALGQETLLHRAIPVTDTFSYTAYGRPILGHAWLFDLFLAVAERLGGLQLIEALTGILILILLRLIYQNARIAGASTVAAVIAIIAFVFTENTLLVTRPQLVTFLFLGLLFQLIYTSDGSNRKIFWQIPLLLILWANLHGGFLAGLCFLGLWLMTAVLEHFAERTDTTSTRIRTAILVLALSMVASLGNPYGLYHTVYALKNTPLASPIFSLIDEWQQPRGHIALFLDIGILAGVAFGLLRRRMLLTLEVVWFSAAALLSLDALRHAAVFGVIGIPIVAAWATRPAKTTAPDCDRQSLLIPLSALLCIMGTVVFPVDLLASASLRRQYPEEAAEWIIEHPGRGEIFNQYEWGGYLDYRFRGAPGVYIDSRMAPFLPDIASEYLVVINAQPDWQAIVKRRGIKLFLLRPEAPLARSGALARAGWQRVVDQSGFLLFAPASAEESTELGK